MYALLLHPNNCTTNTREPQIERLKAFAEDWDTFDSITISDFQVLQTFASRNNNKGIKRDGSLPAEVFKWLGSEPS